MNTIVSAIEVVDSNISVRQLSAHEQQTRHLYYFVFLSHALSIIEQHGTVHQTKPNTRINFQIHFHKTNIGKYMGIIGKRNCE